MKAKRYCYLVIHEKTPGLLYVFEPPSIVNAYSSRKKAEKRARRADKDGIAVFIHRVNVN